jgi:hypothetical protein
MIPLMPQIIAGSSADKRSSKVTLILLLIRSVIGFLRCVRRIGLMRAWPILVLFVWVHVTATCFSTYPNRKFKKKNVLIFSVTSLTVSTLLETFRRRRTQVVLLWPRGLRRIRSRCLRQIILRTILVILAGRKLLSIRLLIFIVVGRILI